MKAENIIILIGLVLIGLITGVFFSAYSSEKIAGPPVETSLKKNASESSISDKPNSNFTQLVSTGKNVCEGCHLSGKKSTPQADRLKQHVGGGAYCLKCHTIDHKVHPINDNVTCERCHGSSTTPSVPEYRDGKIVCEECHDYPDPYQPSNGNLVQVHRPRNVDCIRCHIDATDSCKKCHNEIKSDEKWNKRLTHFNTIMNTAK